MSNDNIGGGPPQAPSSAETVSGEGFTPDPNMTAWELDVLRVMNGEEVPDIVGGAAMWVAAAWLKGRGYVEGCYNISQKGRDYLATLAHSQADAGRPTQPREEQA